MSLLTWMQGGAIWQFTHSLHWLGAVVMALPETSSTHGIDLLATAVPCTTAVMFVPGQLAATQPTTKFVVPPAGTKTLPKVTAPPLVQLTKPEVNMSPPTMFTL